MDDLEDAVARHYGASNLGATILGALAAAGLNPEHLKPADLAPVDEFHIGGRAATVYVLDKLDLTAGSHVLDVGCGIGGATRYMADTLGCRVAGIDLTPEYIEVARMLAERTGLSEAIEYKVASALDLPFGNGAFDAVITLHVAMNIKDRARLYREMARVLRSGGELAVYDVMQGPGAGLTFPVPWAQTPATSHLETPEGMAALLGDAGFDVVETEDRTDYGIAFFRQRLAAMAGGQPPALGLHHLMGADARAKFRNMLAGLEARAIAPVVMIARRR